MKTKNSKIIPIIISILIAAFIFYLTPLGDQYEFSFFHTTLSRALNIILCIAILIPIIFILINSLYTQDIGQQRETFRYRKGKKISAYLVFILLSLFLILYLSVALSRIVLSMNNYMWIKSNEMIGKKVHKEFAIELKTALNTTFNKEINVGYERYPRYIIDPVKYKLFIILHDDQYHYPLKEYCSTVNGMPVLRPQRIYISGYYSFMGFSADQNQHLSEYFTDDRGKSISSSSLNTCKFIYDQTPIHK